MPALHPQPAYLQKVLAPHGGVCHAVQHVGTAYQQHARRHGRAGPRRGLQACQARQGRQGWMIGQGTRRQDSDAERSRSRHATAAAAAPRHTLPLAPQHRPRRTRVLLRTSAGAGVCPALKSAASSFSTRCSTNRVRVYCRCSTSQLSTMMLSAGGGGGRGCGREGRDWGFRLLGLQWRFQKGAAAGTARQAPASSCALWPAAQSGCIHIAMHACSNSEARRSCGGTCQGSQAHGGWKAGGKGSCG